jgi:hypothetical protein
MPISGNHAALICKYCLPIHEERAVLSCLGGGLKRRVCVPRRQLVHASKLLPTVFPFYEVNPSISRLRVGIILNEKRNGRRKYVKV